MTRNSVPGTSTIGLTPVKETVADLLWPRSSQMTESVSGEWLQASPHSTSLFQTDSIWWESSPSATGVLCPGSRGSTLGWRNMTTGLDKSLSTDLSACPIISRHVLYKYMNTKHDGLTEVCQRFSVRTFSRPDLIKWVVIMKSAWGSQSLSLAVGRVVKGNILQAINNYLCPGPPLQHTPTRRRRGEGLQGVPKN